MTLVVAELAYAQGPADQPPPLPVWTQRPSESPLAVDDKGDVSWPGIKHPLPVDWRSGLELALRRWNPSTGATGEVPLGLRGSPGRAAAMGDGLVFVFSESGPVATRDTQYAVLVTQGGRIVRSAPLASSFNASWVVLADRSAVLIGGRDGGERSMVVERVVLAGAELMVQRMPDLPGPPRGAYATVALADGRLMVLGGNSGPYGGCLPCLADTHILDPVARTWQPGPAMLQARAGHTATRLPNGNVWVAGGWTPKEDWSAGPTRSTERWQPGSAGFMAGEPMVNGSAEHEAVWMPGQAKPLLLMAGGTSTTIQAYAPDAGLWRAVGASARRSRNSHCFVVPFVRDGRAWLWQLNRSEPQYGLGDCKYSSENGWVLTPLRLPGAPADAPAQSGGSASVQGPGVMLDRSASAFVPAQLQRPALVIAGTAGEDARTQSAAVDAIAPNGVATAYPPLKFSRRGAKAVRLANGVLVAGGFGGADNQPRQDAQALPAEWLPDTAATGKPEWVELPGAPGHADALGADADGQGLVLINGDHVNRLTVVPGFDGRPKADQDPLPPLNRARRSGNDDAESVQIRGLADGRIVVAGGAVQADKIALLRPDSNQATSVDEYLGIGEVLPSRRHEIFDPVQRIWRNSAPSLAAGGHAAILDDGRVVKFAVITHQATIDKAGREIEPLRWEGVLEISSADGTRWLNLADKLPPGVRSERIRYGRPFVVDGELLLATMGKVDIGGPPSLLLWLDTASGQWETLWEAKQGDNWRAHVGRHIVRQLANGKRIVVPVQGF